MFQCTTDTLGIGLFGLLNSNELRSVGSSIIFHLLADVDYIQKGMASEEPPKDVLGSSYKDFVAKSEKPMTKVYGYVCLKLNGNVFFTQIERQKFLKLVHISSLKLYLFTVFFLILSGKIRFDAMNIDS